jgi:methionyl-tRNA formyltransferase
MKILILKGDAPRHNYFANQINNLQGFDKLTMSYSRLSQNRLWNTFLKSPKTFFSRSTKYIFKFLRGWNSKEQAFFNYPSSKQDHIVDSFNSLDSIKIMRDFEPDILVAFGIPIITNKVIEIPKYGAINLHGGISPDYKGGNTIFWPLYKNDINKVGATLHYMVKKVDSGKVISKVYPKISSDDNEFTVSAKTFKLATNEMINIVNWIKSNNKKIPGEEQNEKGNLYLAKHRTFIVDIFGPIKIKKNLSYVFKKERIKRFY